MELTWPQILIVALWLAREIYMTAKKAKAGYRRKPKQYRLRFEDPDMEGFECLAKSVTVDEFVTLSIMATGLATGATGDIGSVFDLLASSIVEWNLLEDDDTDTPVPIAWAVCRESRKQGTPGTPCPDHRPEDPEDPGKPCDYTGLCAQDIDFTMQILMGWMSAIASVPPPLLSGSNNGGISPEVSQQLASLSRSLPNS